MVASWTSHGYPLRSQAALLTLLSWSLPSPPTLALASISVRGRSLPCSLVAFFCYSVYSFLLFYFCIEKKERKERNCSDHPSERREIIRPVSLMGNSLHMKATACVPMSICLSFSGHDKPILLRTHPYCSPLFFQFPLSTFTNAAIYSSTQPVQKWWKY